MTVLIAVEKKEISVELYSDLLRGYVRTISQLVNLMARVKAWCEINQPNSARSQLDTTVQCLEG
jgi:hypothetical protein